MTYSVKEIFLTLQGEGAQAGRDLHGRGRIAQPGVYRIALGQAGRPHDENRNVDIGEAAEGFQPVVDVVFAFGEDNGAGPEAVAPGRGAVGTDDAAIECQPAQLLRQSVHTIGQTEYQDVECASHPSPCR